jgi:hypothetical protein
LEENTSEMVYTIAGPEFGGFEGHKLIIRKSLYGLRSSGTRWKDRFADCMLEIDFFSCKSEPDIWMLQHGKLYLNRSKKTKSWKQINFAYPFPMGIMLSYYQITLCKLRISLQ